MAAPSSSSSSIIPNLYVGARVKCTAHPNLHVTLAYVGDCDEKRLFSVKQALMVRADMPLRFKLGEWALFGPKNDIPVIKCTITLKTAASLWQSFYDAYGQLPPGWTEPKPAAQNYHVTLKRPGVGEELREKEEIVCTELFLEQLGPHEPIFRIPLPER
jgi:2'-5' RNA ligase